MKNTNKASLAAANRSKERQAYALIAPQLIGFFVFSLYPILWVVRYAFYKFDGIDATFCGLDNFVRAFTRDPQYWKSIINTMIIAYGKLIIEIPLSLVVALLLSNNLIKVRKIFTVSYYLPSVTGSAVNAMIFCFMFATVNGTVNNALLKIGFIDVPVEWFAHKWTAMAVIIIQSLWKGFAVNTLYFMAGVQNISDDVLEAARVDGATKLQEFTRITIPMLMPTVRIILMLAMISGMQIMNDVMLITNGGPAGSTNVVMLQIYKMYFEPAGIAQYGYASALGVILSVILGIITFVYLKISKKADEVM